MLPLSAPRPGHDFGAYQLIRTIGEGGMGTVYEATHKALQKRVAIKILLPKLANNEESVSRFLREGRATSAINHPNVVGVFDVGVHENMPYLVMEYLEGETLAAKLKRERKLAPKDISDILVPILAGRGGAR